MTRTPLVVRRMDAANEAMKDHLESNRIVDEKTGEFWVPDQLPADPDDPEGGNVTEPEPHVPHAFCEPGACIEVDASDPAQADCPMAKLAEVVENVTETREER